ncbi:hypothetical protein G4B88_012095 [Cannabis sativa]|uniref:Uncharacterized protein n=1 Tax=Cannabis sativa TaxID=3483 RepID=A0A7J6DR06_CANSA|nr:hypothetical protein G4B88_012095 [Cannabis sativa]
MLELRNPTYDRLVWKEVRRQVALAGPVCVFKSEWRSRGAAVATSISLGEQILTLRHIKELGLKDIFEKSRQYFRNRRTQYASAKVLNFSVRFWPNAPKLFFPVAEFKALEDLRLKIFYRRIR